ncbi:hypothetical protein DUNSADRAFT_287 [Dunaliella salina]|uniref:Uncharacterized protein n=1 Tax=Dunaliella salina TaxID=3046 RepID=A0ABQ7GYF8_DUNSA|nr:hypothetical protein DUNSADRAFT_287 [Dunaliella salina]|eukprot:KAF5839631.1 hypothetical protein DUNSADRAFT_287 [Dunaliella salina]
MLSICKDPEAYGSDALPSLVAHWQAAWAPVQQQQQQQQQQKQQGDEDDDIDGTPQEVLQAGCSVLCAAGAALLPQALAAGGAYHAQFIAVAEQLLQQLTSKDVDVALTSLEFWQDTYVATLQGLPSDARQAALASHTGLLQHLTTSLVVRSHLDPEVANSATADARDLPEDVRMVRRELSSALRDISSLVGPQEMTSYMANIVQAALAQYTQSSALKCVGHVLLSLLGLLPSFWLSSQCELSTER